MNHTSVSDARALRTAASAFDAQRGKLPDPGDLRSSRSLVGIALREAADSLHSASAVVSAPSVRLQAALSRSTPPAPAPSSPGATVPAAAVPADRIARSR